MTEHTVTLTDRRTGTSYDVLDYLHDEADVVVAVERERLRFEFVCDDITLKLSNMDGALETAMRAMQPADKWLLEWFVDGNRRFRGFVRADDITLDKNEEWLSITSFSSTRALWDVLETTRVRTANPGNLNFNPLDLDTLDGLFKQELIRNHRLGLGYWGEGVFGTVDLGEFATRPVNYPRNAFAGPANGRFTDIDPAMSWADFLKELSKYYNAEFYVDPGTGNLFMRRRNAPTGRTFNLDGRVRDDKAPRLKMIGERGVAYVKMFTEYPVAAPYLVKAHTYSGTLGWMNGVRGGDYIVLYKDSDDNILYASEPTKIEPPFLPNGYISLELALPIGPDGTGIRELYRRDRYMPSWGYRLVDRRENNVDASTCRDNFRGESVKDQPLMPTIPRGQLVNVAFWQYDSDKNSWSVTIEGAGDPPLGEGLDLVPTIGFSSSAAPDDVNVQARDTFVFFGAEMKAAFVHDQYAELFEPRREIEIVVRDTDFCVGDQVTFSRDQRFASYGTMTIKRAEIHPLAEYSKLTCTSRVAI